MAKKGKSVATTDAQKAEKWTELAEKRLNRALGSIKGLTKLANKRYRWTPHQVKVMKDSFEKALDVCFGAYEGKAQAQEEVKL